MAIAVATPRPDVEHVYLIGDSLGVGLLPHLKQLATRDGVKLDGAPVGGTTIPTWTNGAQYQANVAGAIKWPTTHFFVSLGTNDALGKGVIDVAPLVTRLRSSGARVSWIGPPNFPGSPAAVASLKRQCAALGVQYIDSTKISFEHAKGDKIHATPRGYATWAAWLWPQAKSTMVQFENSAAVGWWVALVTAVAVGLGAYLLIPVIKRKRNPWGDGEDAYAERYANAFGDFWSKLVDSKPGDRYPWTKINVERAGKIWRHFAKTGQVSERDVKALDAIASEMVDKVVLLELFTDMGGHTDWLTFDIVLKHNGVDPEDPEVAEAADKFADYILDERGQWRISDYAVGPLHRLAVKVLEAETPEETIVLVDRMFNITHQRSDLAGWFIKGGRAALERLSDGSEDDE